MLKLKGKCGRELRASITLGILFSINLIIGASFEEYNSFYGIVGGNAGILKSVLSLLVYIPFCTLAAMLLFRIFDILGKRDIQFKMTAMSFMSNYDKRRFIVALILIQLIFYIPYIIVSYPAIFMGDTGNQIQQAFNVPDYTSRYLKLLSDDVYLNRHHPLLYTLYLRLFVSIGTAIFKSGNVGIFLAGLCQMLFVFFVIALWIAYLCENSDTGDLKIGGGRRRYFNLCHTFAEAFGIYASAYQGCILWRPYNA